MPSARARYNEAYAEAYPLEILAINLREAREAGRQINEHPPHVEASKIAHDVAMAWVEVGDSCR